MNNPDRLINEVIIQTLNMIDGEYDVKGGFGNRIVHQFKIENGIHSDKWNGQWVEVDIHNRIYKLIIK